MGRKTRPIGVSASPSINGERLGAGLPPFPGVGRPPPPPPPPEGEGGNGERGAWAGLSAVVGGTTAAQRGRAHLGNDSSSGPVSHRMLCILHSAGPSGRQRPKATAKCRGNGKSQRQRQSAEATAKAARLEASPTGEEGFFDFRRRASPTGDAVFPANGRANSGERQQHRVAGTRPIASGR